MRRVRKLPHAVRRCGQCEWLGALAAVGLPNLAGKYETSSLGASALFPASSNAGRVANLTFEDDAS
jgi:hypothetical protein